MSVSIDNGPEVQHAQVHVFVKPVPNMQSKVRRIEWPDFYAYMGQALPSETKALLLHLWLWQHW